MRHSVSHSLLFLTIANLTQAIHSSGSWINPTWFALDSSRGIESQESLVYMRSTALAFDTLVYIPALLLFLNAWQGTRSKRTQVCPISLYTAEYALTLTLHKGTSIVNLTTTTCSSTGGFRTLPIQLCDAR